MLLSVFPVCVVPVILPLIKVLLGSKRQARNFLDIYILVILVSKQFATFLHISLSHLETCLKCEICDVLVGYRQIHLGFYGTGHVWGPVIRHTPSLVLSVPIAPIVVS